MWVQDDVGPGRRLVTRHRRREDRRRRPVPGQDHQRHRRPDRRVVLREEAKHDFGANIQAVMRPDGFPVRVGDVEPGSVHDLTCAREHAPGARYAFPAGGLPTRADPGYEGAGIGVHTPARHRLPTQNRPNRESRSGAHPIRAPIHNSLRSAHWTDASLGDPAIDPAWVVHGTPARFRNGVLRAYYGSRTS